ncbi:MAG TPA: helix-turn-helix transcriptional regulator [Thermoanaerobaculia bacterium]|jgi:transcriptional regulator with XRE-family HTH domain|nr:helix-turn-helix transcriptional regulator [Thermoanaerobaculia bacterium]
MTDQGQRGLLEEVGRRIVRLREKRGWTRADLARRLGVPRGRLAHWERGENTPPLEVLAALRRELGVSLDELVTGEPPAGGPAPANPAAPAAPADGLCGNRKDEALRHLCALMRLVQGGGNAQGGKR